MSSILLMRWKVVKVCLHQATERLLMKVLRAALDVFEEEPEIHPKLKENPNVVCPLQSSIDIADMSTSHRT